MFRITDGKGFHITFANGWTVSVQFGPGNYSSNRDDAAVFSGEYKDECRKAGEYGATTVEVAAWPKDGCLMQIESDTVAGWKDASWVLNFMNEIAAK